ncbi:MAG TPA: tripartite tricarboxylate transporter substrate binding protein [Casimicrobiaceae bacterium]|nr:tripartite tricarboxylate transporter substrate binding protein [Casimicrobiaceae bacterium]
MKFETTKRLILAAAYGLVLGSPPLLASSDKPLRVVLPVSAGSGVDTIVRALGPQLNKSLAQPVVFENLPGAGGITGTTAIVKAPADGQTIGVISNNHVINPSVFKSLPYHTLNDITPIMVAGSTPFVLVVNPTKLPAKDLKELVALLKANPGAYNYASSGNGTIIHLAGALFADEAGVDIKHVPYKGVGPMLSDLIAGHVDLGVAAVPAVQGHLKSGALRAIGVGTAARIPQLPDVPTMVEQGLPNYVVGGWFAVVGPAKLPAADVKRIHTGFTTAFATPEVKDAMAAQGNIINPTTPEAAAQFMRDEQERYAKIVNKIGLKPE